MRADLALLVMDRLHAATDPAEDLFRATFSGTVAAGTASPWAADIGSLTVVDTYTSTQMVLNPGFETATGTPDDGTSDTWTSWTVAGGGAGDYIDSTATVHGGSKAIKIVRATSAMLLSSAAAIATVPGYTYNLSFWTRGDGSVAGRYSVQNQADSTYIFAAVSTGVTAAVYAQVSVSFVAPANCTSVKLAFLGPGGAGTVYFDDVSLLPTTALLSQSGGKLVCAGGKSVAAGGDPAVWANPATVRVAGRVARAAVTDLSTKIVYLGWDSNQSGGLLAGSVAITSTALIFGASGFGVIVPGGTYTLWSVLRAAGYYWFIQGGTFTSPTLFCIVDAGTESPIYFGAQGYSGSWTADDLRVCPVGYLPTPFFSDTFNRGNGAMGSSEATGPDGQACPTVAWAGATWAISGNAAVNTVVPAGELLSNTGFETAGGGGTDVYANWAEGLGGTSTITDDAVTPHGGGHAAIMTTDAGNSLAQLTQNVLSNYRWYLATGWAKSNPVGTISVGDGGGTAPGALFPSVGLAWTQVRVTLRLGASTTFTLKRTAASTALEVDDWSCQEIPVAQTVLSAGAVASGSYVSRVVAPYAVGFQSGMWARLDSAATPANGLIAYWDGAGKLNLATVLAGVYADIISVTTTHVAGTQMSLYQYLSDANTLVLRLVYGTAQVGTTQTLTRAGGYGAIIDARVVGGFSTDPSAVIDSISVTPLGTGGEHGALAAT